MQSVNGALTVYEGILILVEESYLSVPTSNLKVGGKLILPSWKPSNILPGMKVTSLSKHNTMQYNFIAKCQYTDCTRNVL